MKTTNTISINKNIILRKEDDDAFLYHPDTGGISVINGTGIYIWESLSQGSQTTHILEKLIEMYPDQDKAKVQDDYESFIKVLIDMKYAAANKQ